MTDDRPVFHVRAWTCLFSHYWSRWEVYQFKGTSRQGKLDGTFETTNFTEDRQRRFCLACGVGQDEKLCDGGGGPKEPREWREGKKA